jgi:hypothetical protein
MEVGNVRKNGRNPKDKAVKLAAIESIDAAAALESLSHPVRRHVLRRLATGPASFTEALEAAHIEDTSLIAFHLRKLRNSGHVKHLGRAGYALTPRGIVAIQILFSIDSLAPVKRRGRRVVSTKATKRTTT